MQVFLISFSFKNLSDCLLRKDLKVVHLYFPTKVKNRKKKYLFVKDALVTGETGVLLLRSFFNVFTATFR